MRICLLSAVLCPPLAISNAAINTTAARYSTVVGVTCKDGYAIDPLNWRKNTAMTFCTKFGTWSSSIVCTGLVKKDFLEHLIGCNAIMFHIGNFALQYVRLYSYCTWHVIIGSRVWAVQH
jgi:hypothetical protein